MNIDQRLKICIYVNYANWVEAQMKAKYFGNSSPLFSKGTTYAIFSGTYDAKRNQIIDIRTQVNDDCVCICDITLFSIDEVDFNRYRFSCDKTTFAFECISYNDFWDMFYTDRPERVDEYIQAKKGL